MMTKKILVIVSSLLVILGLVTSISFAKEKEVVTIYPAVYGGGPEGDTVGCKWPAKSYQEYLDYSLDPDTNLLFWGTAAAIYTFNRIHHEDIRVVPRNPLTGPQLLVAMAGGTAPDQYIASSEFAEKGMCADITEFVTEDPEFQAIRNKIPSRLWAECMYKGRYYMVPARCYQPACITYRMDVFEKAGIFNEEGIAGPPKDWTTDDFREIAKKLTSPKENMWAFSIGGGNSWINMFGQIVLDNCLKPDPTERYTWRSNLDTPEVAEIYQWFKDIVWKDKSCLFGEKKDWNLRDFEYTGRTAMISSRGMDSSLAVGFAPICLTREHWNWTKFPKAYADYQYSNMGAGGLIGILPTLDKERIKANWEFLKYYYFGKEGVLATWYLLTAREGNYRYGMASVSTLCDFDIPGMEKVVPPRWEKIYDQLVAIPLPPSLAEFKIKETSGALWGDMAGLFEVVVFNEKSDVEKELAKSAQLINSSLLNYKTEGVGKDNFKAYYTALGDFYKKNFPEYYEEYYTNLLEKYYKIW